MENLNSILFAQDSNGILAKTIQESRAKAEAHVQETNPEELSEEPVSEIKMPQAPEIVNKADEIVFNTDTVGLSEQKTDDAAVKASEVPFDPYGKAGAEELMDTPPLVLVMMRRLRLHLRRFLPRMQRSCLFRNMISMKRSRLSAMKINSTLISLRQARLSLQSRYRLKHRPHHRAMLNGRRMIRSSCRSETASRWLRMIQFLLLTIFLRCRFMTATIMILR